MRALRRIPAATLVLAAAAGCAARGGAGPSAPAVPSAGPGVTSEAEAGADAADADPVVREIVLEGVRAFSPATVHRAIRLRPGRRLRRPAAEVAFDLQRRYEVHGYPAARVAGTFDPEGGVLTLRVEEGRLRQLEVEGVAGGAAERARRLLALPAGEPVKEKDLRAALRRLESESGGAFQVVGEPPYAFEPLDDGVRLRIAVAPVRTKLRVRLSGPDPSGLRTRVEGTAPGAGLELTVFDPDGLQHTHLHARGAYGFSSDTARFALGVQRPFARHRLVLGYEFHDLTDTDDVFRRFNVAMPPGNPRPTAIFEDYFRRRGHEAFAFVRPSPRLHLGLSWRRDRFESLPVVADDSLFFFFFSRRPRPNPEIAPGERDAVLFTARWAARAPLYARAVDERDSFLLHDPYGGAFDPVQGARLTATFEAAGESDAGSAPYQRFIAHARGRRLLTPAFALDGRLLVGVGNDLPVQRRFALGGTGTLRGYSVKRFAGDRAVLATLEGRYRPPSRWPDLIAFYDGGMAWTSEGGARRWRDDVGLGLEWPGGDDARIRVDGAVALRPPPGDDRARVHAVIVLPF
ncbi:MAG TPA: BamA/TamA family outer membrane protein [Vicinamibacteria bacterium]|nr:BamA/TamA family outer membrane protein [Vicinamibacteria bacterium]